MKIFILAAKMLLDLNSDAESDKRWVERMDEVVPLDGGVWAEERLSADHVTSFSAYIFEIIIVLAQFSVKVFGPKVAALQPL